jgi:Tfp pilus assembly PilM family ATPase
MARSFPPDVLVIDRSSILFARLEAGKQNPLVSAVKRYPLPAELWTDGPVSPGIGDPAPLIELIRRIRKEQGKLDRVSILLPDSWFRLVILEPASVPHRHQEAEEMIRWSLKRMLPVRPEDLRISWHVIGKTDTATRVLVAAAMEKTLAALEESFRAAGVTVVLIESLGLNVWNSIAARETATTADRVFLYLHDRDFTTALFRGDQPMFLRSRSIGDERSLLQEVRLSASYLASNLETETVERCYIAGGSIDNEMAAKIAQAFAAPAERVSLRDFASLGPSVDASGMEAELTACTGVFTA